MLSVNHLKKSFGGITAVKNCSFEVQGGSITALIGPNGAGKTTVFNIVTGFMLQDHGEIFFNNKNIDELPSHKRAALGIARTFQTIRLFPKMTVLENLLLAMPNTKEQWYHAFQNSALKKIEEENKKVALTWLSFVGLHAKIDEAAGNLSYGQQKLLEIARALCRSPKLLMLDEPAAGVNPAMLKKIGELLTKLKQQGMTILFIEHDMEFVMGIADKIIVLDYGEEIAIGKPVEIQKNQRVIDAYLGVG